MATNLLAMASTSNQSAKAEKPDECEGVERDDVDAAAI